MENSKNKKGNSITLNELYSELDKHRRIPQGLPLTQEQKEFLLSARDEKKGVVMWKTIRGLWIKKGWQPLSETSLARRYNSIK